MVRVARLVPSTALAVVALTAFGLAACGRSDDSGAAIRPTSAVETTDDRSVESTDDRSVESTDDGPVESTTTQQERTSATMDAAPVSESGYPTTTTHIVPPTCDDELDEMLAVVDRSIAGARLSPGGTWSAETDGAAFDERTLPAEEFRYRLGLDCTVRAVQRADGGGERLVVGAWTGQRRAYVVQATDGPATPYSPDIRFQLFIDQPDGEWVEDQAVWVGTLNSGETVIVGTADTSTGLTAKSWWVEVPRFADLDVTIDAERYAIDALIQAGARNVSVAEPADYNSELAAVQFITPAGLVLIGTIGPPDWFDPAAQLFDGEMAVVQIGGVDVNVLRGAPDAYGVGSVGWMCGEYVWYIDSAYGTVEELTDWAATLIDSTGC